MYKLLTFVGRFQPFHCGHKIVVDKALSLSEQVLILIGSNEDGRTLRNPWTYDERVAMIRSVYPNEHRLTFARCDDQPSDPLWVQHVNDHIAKLIEDVTDVGLIGCNKDHTSYYLQLFPHLKSEAVEFINPLNATDIRAILWEESHKYHEMADVVIPKHVADIVYQPEMGMDSQETAECIRNHYKESLNG